MPRLAPNSRRASAWVRSDGSRGLRVSGRRPEHRALLAMRLALLLITLLGGFVLVGMLIAPYEPTLRSWYLQRACRYLDQLSADIWAAARREAGSKAA